MQPIRTLDMFSGIGGFRSGLEAIGGFSFVGHCEIDKYANQAYEAIYQPKGELYFNDARKIDPYALPDIDLICGGFPCQSFSIAGQRKCFDDERGTLFFEIARIAKVKRPAFLLLENVPGLLSADGGRSYAAILTALDELGYDVAWQVLNSKDFGVPQFRQRVYIVGYFRDKCAGKILSFTESNGNDLVQSIPGKQGERVYRTDGLSCTLTSNGGGFAGHTGLYMVENPPKLFFIDLNSPPNLTEVARCITARQDSGISHHKGEHSGVLVTEDAPCAVITPDKENVRQQGRRIKKPNEPMFTLTAQDRHGIYHNGRVRKLTPRETWRLQGFTDEQFDRAAATGLSDARLYKMAGNAVSVPVVSAVGTVIKNIYDEMSEQEEPDA